MPAFDYRAVIWVSSWQDRTHSRFRVSSSTEWVTPLNLGETPLVALQFIINENFGPTKTPDAHFFIHPGTKTNISQTCGSITVFISFILFCTSSIAHEQDDIQHEFCSHQLPRQWSRSEAKIRKREYESLKFFKLRQPGAYMALALYSYRTT